MDFQKDKDDNEKIEKVLEYVTACQQFSPGNIDYHFFTDTLKEISGAAIVGLNLVSEEDKNKIAVKAVSRAPEVLSHVMKAAGLKLEGTEWDVNREAMKYREKNKLMFFTSFKDIGYEGAAPRLASVLKIIEKVLNPNGLYIMEFDYQGDFLGVIFLIMPRNKTLEKKELIELFINQIAGTIKRLRAENKLQHQVNALRESENHLSTTLSSIGDGVIVTDTSGKITRVNPQAEKLTGWTADKALGRAVYEVLNIVNENTGELAPNPVYNVINSGRTHNLADNTILVARTGEKCYIADSAAPIRDDEGKLLGVVMVFSDVTQRKNAEESLKHQFRFEKMLADISSIFATQPSDQLTQSINHALKQVGEFFQVERSYVFQFSDDGKHAINTYLWFAENTESQMDKLQSIPVEGFPWWVDQIKNKQNVIISNVNSLPPEAAAEKALLVSQNIKSLVSIPMMSKGVVFGFLGIDAVKEKKNWTENQTMLLTLVTELAANAYTRSITEEKVRYHSLHDGLTGLYNRFFLEKEMERLDTERQLPIGIMMIDLNGFKIVNDTFGHDVGDDMLKQTAEIFRNSCRKEDIIARWGGDEFVIFLPQTTEEDAEAISRRIDENSKKNLVKGIPISMAIGYAIKASASQKLYEILKEAEEKMYQHKLAENPRARGK